MTKSVRKKEQAVVLPINFLDNKLSRFMKTTIYLRSKDKSIAATKTFSYQRELPIGLSCSLTDEGRFYSFNSTFVARVTLELKYK